MSQYENSGRPAGDARTEPGARAHGGTTGTSFAADSPNVMARLPDLGTPSRDIDLDFPADGRGRMLGSRLAMPILMGAGVILLIVALVPFLFGKKDSADVAGMDSWHAENSGEETGEPQPWDGGTNPGWDGTQQVPPNTQFPGAGTNNWQNENPQVGVRPESAPPGVWQEYPGSAPGTMQPTPVPDGATPGWQNSQIPEQNQAWSRPMDVPSTSGPPQPAPWSVEHQALEAATPQSATGWQQQGSQPTWDSSGGAAAPPAVAAQPWANTVTPQSNPSIPQPGISPTPVPLAASPRTNNDSYGGYQSASPAPGYYENFQQPDSMDQQPSSAYQPPQASANRAAAITPQAPAASTEYGALNQRPNAANGPSAPAAFPDAAPASADRWARPNTDTRLPQDASNSYRRDYRQTAQVQPVTPPPVDYPVSTPPFGQQRYDSASSTTYPATARYSGSSQPSAAYAPPANMMGTQQASEYQPYGSTPPSNYPQPSTPGNPQSYNYPGASTSNPPTGSYNGLPASSGYPTGYPTSSTDPNTGQYSGRFGQPARY
jgi:hypothetical protein